MWGAGPWLHGRIRSLASLLPTRRSREGGITSDTIDAVLAMWIVREARSRAGLGLRELARLAGTSHATLARYERGDVDPTMGTLERIVAACGFELRVLLESPDRQDEELARSFARLSPRERLESLHNWNELRERALPR